VGVVSEVIKSILCTLFLVPALYNEVNLDSDNVVCQHEETNLWKH